MNLPPNGGRISAGTTVIGTELALYRFGTGNLPVILLGGVHGDESEGYLLAERLIQELESGKQSIADAVSLFIAPRANPDGCRANRRTNERNVDLNRNLPTRDWTGSFENVRYYPGPVAGSERESAFTLALIDTIIEPAGNGLIISLHSYEQAMINYNGECLNLAEGMSRYNGLPPKGDIGYPTPGSLGTYAGWERNIPTITLEIKRGQAPEDVWEQHLTAVLFAAGFYTSQKLPTRGASAPAG